jgi:hypothetical protein
LTRASPILDCGFWIENEDASALKSKIRNPKSQMTWPCLPDGMEIGIHETN